VGIAAPASSPPPPFSFSSAAVPAAVNMVLDYECKDLFVKYCIIGLYFRYVMNKR